MQNGNRDTQSHNISRFVEREQELKEIRELSAEHLKKLGDFLAKEDQWKELMSKIPGMKAGGKRFDIQDIE